MNDESSDITFLQLPSRIKYHATFNQNKALTGPNDTSRASQEGGDKDGVVGWVYSQAESLYISLIKWWKWLCKFFY